MGNSGHGDGRERESPQTRGISPDITCVAWYALTFRCLHVPFVLQPKDHGYISSWNTSLFLSIASFSLCLGTFTCHSHPPTNPRRPPPNSFIPYISIPPIGHTTPPPGPGGGGRNGASKKPNVSWIALLSPCPDPKPPFNPFWLEPA